MTQLEMPKDKRRKRAATSNKWYAFIHNKVTGEPTVIAQKGQQELKEQLREMDESLEVLFIVRGRGFKPRIQRSFAFVEGEGAEESIPAEMTVAKAPQNQH